MSGVYVPPEIVEEIACYLPLPSCRRVSKGFLSASNNVWDRRVAKVMWEEDVCRYMAERYISYRAGKPITYPTPWTARDYAMVLPHTIALFIGVIFILKGLYELI